MAGHWSKQLFPGGGAGSPRALVSDTFGPLLPQYPRPGAFNLASGRNQSSATVWRTARRYVVRSQGKGAARKRLPSGSIEASEEPSPLRRPATGLCRPRPATGQADKTSLSSRA